MWLPLIELLKQRSIEEYLCKWCDTLTGELGQFCCPNSPSYSVISIDKL